MGDFIFKIKGPVRELEIQVPFSTGITETVDLIKELTKKPEPPKKWYQRKKKDDEDPSVITAAAMTALSVILASNNSK